MFGSSKENLFWQWFQKNEAMLYSFEENPEEAFAQLSLQLAKVDENLAFLFGPPREDGTREFIVSANGIAASFPAVEALYAAAPALPRWTFGKFRPRLEPPEHITLEARTLMSDDISYRMYEDGEKVGILIFIEGLAEQERYLFQHIGFLFLDHILGEYDVGTRVGFIEFLPALDDRAAGASPLTDLAVQFDGYLEQRKKGLQ
jgi:hypothetical protein